MTERIGTAAIKVGDDVWTLPRPARHHVLIHAAITAHRGRTPTRAPPDSGTVLEAEFGRALRIGSRDQGFVTSEGRFVGRREAAVIALLAGQISSSKDRLFSEDLW